MAFEQTTSAVQATITLRKIVTHPYFSMVCVLSVSFHSPTIRQYSGDGRPRRYIVCIRHAVAGAFPAVGVVH